MKQLYREKKTENENCSIKNNKIIERNSNGVLFSKKKIDQNVYFLLKYNGLFIQLR